ncbi:Peptidase M20 domain-containing protein 2 [Colletotrichum siamense]|uniref:Peptidase M20 domain-containing protein 2 n=1 Tax=Colletotrichum siamense TaxID=690259 RepID=A0A9P5F1I0_COLSI|nr:Peptidase M20 domain-containing protein 2 [Colletotrichum siamense]KAF4864444.1 Peptidase M20 domain-containing protein 2 [Colletotrichum siamense]
MATIAPEIAAAMDFAISDAKSLLREVDLVIHQHPELNYEEHHAHDTLVTAMGKLGFKVTPHAYGIPTSLEAEYGEGGRLVVFNAEYDALPGIGHACGHNLIATASLAGFIATVAALKTSGKPGRVKLLGTPAEEGGCGKGMLVGKGAYDGVAACVMAHPAPMFAYGTEGRHGNAFVNHVATTSFKIRFEGKAAHAAASPWEGVNALDAAVLGYNGVSMMRQQMTKDSTVHGIFTDAGIKSNVIPDFAAVEYAVRAPTIEKTLELRDRVVANFRAGAIATGCKMQVEYDVFYAPMRPNKQLSLVFADCAADLGIPMWCDVDTKEVISGATDQGNVGCVVPVIHPIYGIEAKEGQSNHTVGFTEAAGAEPAHERSLIVAKALARSAWAVLTDDEVASKVQREFEETVAERRRKISCEEEMSLIVKDSSRISTIVKKLCSCGNVG